MSALPLAVLAAATYAPAAGAAVTVGSSLTHAPNAAVCAPDPHCTLAHDSLPAAQWAPAGTISPIDG